MSKMTTQMTEDHNDLGSIADAYLKKPYARRLTPDESGGFVASIQEFRGCIAEGDTPAEALENLERAAWSWIVSQLGQGQPIPEPVEFDGYSGKIALRMPRGIHKQAAELASAEQTSLNQLLVAAIASYVGARGVANTVIDDFRRKVEQVAYIAFQMNASVVRYTNGKPFVLSQSPYIEPRQELSGTRKIKMIGVDKWP